MHPTPNHHTTKLHSLKKKKKIGRQNPQVLQSRVQHIPLSDMGLREIY